MTAACSVRVRGVVQGVGFRPFVFRLARANTLAGWVKNGDDGVEIHLEGAAGAMRSFLRDLRDQPPPAARITGIEVRQGALAGLADFTIRESLRRGRPSVPIAPDLAVCDDCVAELFDPANPRHGYPYINCTNCGPRLTIVLDLPYDRHRTTMRDWPLDERCATEFHDQQNRRFHAQPVACPRCGPSHRVVADGREVQGDAASIRETARRLTAGQIVAIKGLGGFHLVCDARNAASVNTLRTRKFRKEKPFALMARDLSVARQIVDVSEEEAALLTSVARPIVLLRARALLAAVAPDQDELGVMLPSTPLHHLLFAAGAPNLLVMTSGNRSSEPIAYDDDDALARLSGLADAFLIGQRPIARRVDDSVVRIGRRGPVILRRARGYAPDAVATLPAGRPILGLGADLKSAITLVVEGQAFVSQHIGDLNDARSLRAFQETVRDFVSMYDVRWDDLLVVHDRHPDYASTRYAADLPVSQTLAVQHHRAHVASVLAERGAWHQRVLGVALDGTGYGDDASVWGGELFVGSVVEGFERVASLRAAALPGGDAAARHPSQAAAGFLYAIEGLPDLTAAPFALPARYTQALRLIERGVRTFTTTSMGRLFDAAAALLGFTREITFEGQAAMWVEQLARRATTVEPYPFPFDGRELDYRPLLLALAWDRAGGRNPAEIARAFHGGVALGVCQAALTLCDRHRLDRVVLSGGVCQNDLLMRLIEDRLGQSPHQVWTNHNVPPNDGGVSLGQAAIGALTDHDRSV